jgi:two-component system, NtrC family, sensor histidine kinase GlrK
MVSTVLRHNPCTKGGPSLEACRERLAGNNQVHVPLRRELPDAGVTEQDDPLTEGNKSNSIVSFNDPTGARLSYSGPRNIRGLTIFWRNIIAQSALIALLVIVSLYAFAQLDKLTRLSTHILVVDSACEKEEKRLLKIFLGELRNAEKYLVLQDKEFYANFLQGKSDFASSLEMISAFVDTKMEKDIVAQIRTLHARYDDGLHAAISDGASWEQTRTQISDEIIERVNELIRLREQILANRISTARDQAAAAATMIAWLALGGISLALLLAYLHARGVSRPLNKLAREMRRVGRGEPTRSLEMRAPPEVLDLAMTFSWMTEELAQLDRLKADFTDHISHELRTPLTAIREGTALVLEEIPGPLTASQRDVLEVVRSHSDRLFKMISTILDLSKMEAEMMVYEFTACDLSSLIQRTVNTVRLVARKRRVNLHTLLAEPLPMVYVDEKRIQQVLDNLLSNALKFTPEGGDVRIAACLKANDDGKGDLLEVRVSDTGEGIPESDLEKVFTRFYQSLQNPGKKLQGTGLGLAIARYIIQAHKGRIWVESRVGQGSTFIFVLPTVARGEKQLLIDKQN